MPDDLLYNLAPKDVGQRLGAHPDTVKRWARTGALAGMQTPGGHWRFRQADVDAFVAAMRNTPAGAA